MRMSNDARREALAKAGDHGPEVCDCDAYAPDNGYPDDLICDALAETFRLVAEWSAQDEQRGREDNADHAMCYVHGSKALDARLAEERAEALREAADDPRQGSEIEERPL